MKISASFKMKYWIVLLLKVFCDANNAMMQQIGLHCNQDSFQTCLSDLTSGELVQWSIKP